MARIPQAVMNERTAAVQLILEENPTGLSVKELVAALKQRGLVLPKSEYQSVYIVLKEGEQKGSVVLTGDKWKLLDEEVNEEVEAAPVAEAVVPAPAKTEAVCAPAAAVADKA